MVRRPLRSASLTHLVSVASCTLALALAACGSERPDGPAPEPPSAIPSAAVGARGTQLEPSRVARSLGAPFDPSLPPGTPLAVPSEPFPAEPPVIEPVVPAPPPPVAPSGTPL